MCLNDTFKLLPFIEQNAMWCLSYCKFNGRHPNSADSVAMFEFCGGSSSLNNLNLVYFSRIWESWKVKSCRDDHCMALEICTNFTNSYSLINNLLIVVIEQSPDHLRVITNFHSSQRMKKFSFPNWYYF